MYYKTISHTLYCAFNWNVYQVAYEFYLQSVQLVFQMLKIVTLIINKSDISWFIFVLFI